MKISLFDLPSRSPSWPPTVRATSLGGVLIIDRPVYPDERGSFQELFCVPDLEMILGEKINIQQANQSVSKPGVIRGLHKAPWGKLVHCYWGEVFQVVVDLREKSPTFKKAFALTTGGKNPVTLWVPPGCGNGFGVIGTSEAIYGYAVTSVYQPGQEIGLKWDDPLITSQIKWPIKRPIVSDKDKQNPGFKDLFPDK